MSDENIIHYIKFIEEFFSIPSEHITTQEIEDSEEFQRGAPIINEIKPIFINQVLKQLQNNGINFNFLKYNYSPTYKFYVEYNLFDFYNNVDNIRSFCLERLQLMKTFMEKGNRNITEEQLQYYNSLFKNIELNIYDTIHIIRNENMFFNNLFLSSFMKQDRDFLKYYSNEQKDYDIILISGESHAIILLKDNIRNQIILFDPSYNLSFLNKYNTFLDIFGHGYEYIILELDVQNVESNFQDLFCLFWCFHFIYFNLMYKVPLASYQEMFIMTSLGTYSYINEIKLFILKIIRDLPIFQTHTNVYWKKYLKYKQKYLKLKNYLN